MEKLNLGNKQQTNEQTAPKINKWTNKQKTTTVKGTSKPHWEEVCVAGT